MLFRSHARHGVRPAKNAEVPTADELDDRDKPTRTDGYVQVKFALRAARAMRSDGPPPAGA